MFNREDTQTGTTPIPIPTTAGVNFSWLKVFQVAVIVTSSTVINNRSVRSSAGLPTGLGWHWKTDTQANWGTSFNQTGGSKAPADTIGVNNAISPPAGFTAITTTATQYDNTSQSTGSTGIDGTLLLALVLAVDGTYGGGPGTATLPNIILGYDEAHHVENLDRDAIGWARDPIATSTRRDRHCRRRGRAEAW